MSSEAVKISVVVPVFNAERFLRFALDSVLNQSYRNWECIAIDDGSTDRSGDILDEYASRDSRFRVVHKENGGESSARNAATPFITGELVTYLDSDDRLFPYALSAFSEIQTATKFDVLRYELRQVSEHKENAWPAEGRHEFERIDYHGCDESPFRFCALGCATVVASSIARQVSWPTLREGADLVFVMDCLLKAGVTVRTKEQFVDYLVHQNSISHKLSSFLLEGTCDYVLLMLEKADAYGISERSRKAMVALVREMMLRKMFGSWKLMGSVGERKSVRKAYWSAILRMADRKDVFARFERAVILGCGGSDLLLGLLVVTPYRIRRKFI